MESYSGRILVEDGAGARFYVHEYRGRRTFLLVRRYMLDTGEPVRRIDKRNFGSSIWTHAAEASFSRAIVSSNASLQLL